MTFVSHCATTRRQLPGQGSRGRQIRRSIQPLRFCCLGVGVGSRHPACLPIHISHRSLHDAHLGLAPCDGPRLQACFFLALTIMQVHVRYPLLWSLLLILFYSPPTEVTARTFALSGERRGTGFRGVTHTHTHTHVRERSILHRPRGSRVVIMYGSIDPCMQHTPHAVLYVYPVSCILFGRENPTADRSIR